jgi:zinc transport system substrate-binding protein
MINPEKKAIYQKNSELAVQKISMLDAQLKTQLLPLQGKPFMVFHNAYQYFIKHYNLNLSGTITDNPAAYSSVKRIKKAQKQLYDNHVQCVFKEPQFSSKPIETVIAHSKTKIGMLDPLGGGLVSGKNHYFDLMKNLGRDLTKCLEQ